MLRSTILLETIFYCIVCGALVITDLKFVWVIFYCKFFVGNQFLLYSLWKPFSTVELCWKVETIFYCIVCGAPVITDYRHLASDPRPGNESIRGEIVHNSSIDSLLLDKITNYQSNPIQYDCSILIEHSFCYRLDVQNSLWFFILHQNTKQTTPTYQTALK